ncbi:MAG: conserved phage C-terminal domain-containing protein [Eubacteriales bacterium]|nr:conserved phage C-terminal domain-containing protein [Eubacteriales bacterium]
MNSRAGTNYRTSSRKTQTLIHARLKEGFTPDDFRTVIDKKSAEWMGTKMESFLRPETLFGTKFEGYLNAPMRSRDPAGDFLQRVIDSGEKGDDYFASG